MLLNHLAFFSFFLLTIRFASQPYGQTEGDQACITNAHLQVIWLGLLRSFGSSLWLLGHNLKSTISQIQMSYSYSYLSWQWQKILNFSTFSYFLIVCVIMFIGFISTYFIVQIEVVKLSISPEVLSVSVQGEVHIATVAFNHYWVPVIVIQEAPCGHRGMTQDRAILITACNKHSISLKMEPWERRLNL